MTGFHGSRFLELLFLVLPVLHSSRVGPLCCRRSRAGRQRIESGDAGRRNGIGWPRCSPGERPPADWRYERTSRKPPPPQPPCATLPDLPRPCRGQAAHSWPPPATVTSQWQPPGRPAVAVPTAARRPTAATAALSSPSATGPIPGAETHGRRCRVPQRRPHGGAWALAATTSLRP